MFKRSLGLDAIRLIACIMVVVFHASKTASTPRYFGPQGHDWLFEVEHIRMPLFFVLSGYLMSTLYLRRASGGALAADFLLKRAKKIFPLYWLALGIMSVATIVVVGSLPFDDTAGVIKTLLLLPQDPSEVGGTGAPIVYPAWVLQYEILAYGLVALSMCSRLLLGGFLWFWPAIYVIGAGSDTWLLSFLGSQWLLIFWFGVVLGQFLGGVEVRRDVAFLWAFAWFVVALVARREGLIDKVTEELTFGLAFCGLILAVRSLSYMGVQRRLAAVVRTGSDASYATFLFHIGVVSAGCRIVQACGLAGTAGHIVSVLLCLVVSLALGVWVNRHIEPRIAHLLNRRATEAPVATPSGNV